MNEKVLKGLLVLLILAIFAIIVTTSVMKGTAENNNKRLARNEACQKCGYAEYTDMQMHFKGERFILECDNGPQIDALAMFKKDKWGEDISKIKEYKVRCHTGGKLI